LARLFGLEEQGLTVDGDVVGPDSRDGVIGEPLIEDSLNASGGLAEANVARLLRISDNGATPMAKQPVNIGLRNA
jgi:hypothetical protein